MKMEFTADMFTSYKNGDTAEDKARFANHFVRFVKSDFKETLFPKWFYNRLSMTFGHIAHYNREGFYGEFSSNTSDKLRFLKMTVSPWHGFAGDPEYTYCDVEKALAKWVKESGLLGKYVDSLNKETEARERGELEYLKAKYPD